jgi:hypothetical protein
VRPTRRDLRAPSSVGDPESLVERTGDERRPPGAEPIEGPLSDWVPRLEALASVLGADPRVRVSFHLCRGIGDAVLQRIEKAWKVDRFEPAIRNLYRSANGVCLLWVGTEHPLFARVEARWRETGFGLGTFDRRRVPPSRLPTTHQVDGFAGYRWDGPGAPPEGSPPWGAIFLPPLQKVLGKRKGVVQTAYGSLPDDLERTIAGRSWRGESFERALRVLDYPCDDCPAAFVMTEGASAPPVMLADDHVSWTRSRLATFESYLEHVLATLGTTRARMEWFAGAKNAPEGPPRPLTLDDVLRPVVHPR